MRLKEETLMGLVVVLTRRGRNDGISLYPLSLGVISLAFVSFLDGCWLGATHFYQRRGAGLEKKNEKQLGFWCLEDDPFRQWCTWEELLDL